MNHSRLTRRSIWEVIVGLLIAVTPPMAAAQQNSSVCVSNVRIFDFTTGHLSGLKSVLVRGDKIERVSAEPIPTGADMVLIDGGGRTLMPGLIDAHWHAMLVRPTPTAAITDDVGYTNLVAGAEATDTLMRGFTTV